MQVQPHPASAVEDRERISAVERTRLLDTPPEESFDRLTRLAAALVKVPITFLALVDEERDFYKSCFGFGEPLAAEREITGNTFCHYTVEERAPLVIPDTLADPVYREVPTVQSLGVRAYLGIPLTSGEGHVIGSFCAVDTLPRTWTDTDVLVMTELAASAMREIELRLLVRDMERAEREKAALLESTGEGIYGVDLEGRCTFINRSAAEMLGFPRDECLGVDMHQLIHHTRGDGTPYPAAECPVFGTLHQAEMTRSDEEVLWRRDGTGFPAEYWSAPIVYEGEVRGAVVTFADITERKAAERELIESARLAAMGAAVGAALTDRGSLSELLQRSAEAAVSHLGLTQAFVWTLDLAGASLQLRASAGAEVARARPGARIGLGETPIGTIAAQGEPYISQNAQEDLLLRASGWISEIGAGAFAAYPLALEERILGVVAVVASAPMSKATLQALASTADRMALAVDRFSAEAARDRALAEREATLRARSRFYATMSHELRTPINAIVGYNDLLLADIYGPLNEQQREGIGRADRAAHHLLELVNDILDLSKLEAGKMELEIQEVGLPELIDDLLATIRPMALEHGYELELDSAPCENRIRTDPRRVRQILLNLLSNAIKFGEHKPIGVHCAASSEGGFTIAIADRGRGISQEDLAQIFEEFSQASDAGDNVTGQSGTGLGLSISKRLAELLEGRLEAESMPGAGSTFRLILPAAPRGTAHAS